MVQETLPFRLFLIGPMGSGKSTIGRQLADLLHCEFLDTDAVIEARAGADITWIFDVEGEDGFRRREMLVVEDLAKRTNVVIATGGGAILMESNRHLMSRSGTVVYLEASVDQQVKRTAIGDNRPLLQKGGRRAILAELMRQRQPLYAELADIIISADRGSARKVARQIRTELSERSLLPQLRSNCDSIER